MFDDQWLDVTPLAFCLWGNLKNFTQYRPTEKKGFYFIEKLHLGLRFSEDGIIFFCCMGGEVRVILNPSLWACHFGKRSANGFSALSAKLFIYQNSLKIILTLFLLLLS